MSVSPLTKLVFSYLEETYGEASTFNRSVKINYKYVVRDVVLAVALFAICRKRGNLLRAAEMMNINRNTLRSTTKDFSKQIRALYASASVQEPANFLRYVGLR